MTQATHTPGPFWYSRSATPEHSPQYTVYAENGDGRDLAIVKGDNAERNAILIAAAPDMVAALETISGKISSYHDADNDDAQMHIIADIETTLSAAIAQNVAVQLLNSAKECGFVS